jgi:hypothetical protein
VERTRWEYRFFTMLIFDEDAFDYDPGTGLPSRQVKDAESLAQVYSDAYAAELASLGDEGWELVASQHVPTPFSYTTHGAYLLTFKRPKAAGAS